MRDKEIVGLYQAYLDVYSNSNEEVEQLDEDVQGAVKGALEKGANIMKTNPVLKAVGSIIAPANPGRKTPTATSGGYRKEEVEELDEAGLPYGPVGKGFEKLPAGKKRAAMMKRASALRTKAMKDDGDGGRGSARGKMGEINAALTNPRLREETDLFDAILEHLVAEGYADTNESALAIMANMSDEWRQSIVEAAADQSDKQIEKGVKTTYKAQNVLDNQHQGRSKGLNKLPRGEREEKAKRMRGRLETRRSDLFGERNKREDESRAELKKKYGL